MRAFIIVLRLFLAAVFLYAAYSKLRQPYLLFAMSIDAYQLLPEWAVLILGRTIPWLELLLGVLLATGYGLRYAAGVATLLLGFFFGVMLQAYVKGMGIDCGCFGLGEKISPFTLTRDGILVMLSLTLTILATSGFISYVGQVTNLPHKKTMCQVAEDNLHRPTMRKLA